MEYKSSLDGITEEMLNGFFEGWPNPPSPAAHWKLLQNSSHIVLAVEEKQVIGFITAISDHVLSAYIPLLEVLPAYQGLGIGSELMKRMIMELDDIYMVDLCCDEDLKPFYEKFKMVKTNGMILRNYHRQNGRS
ncbi:GNAT family N-acetyltransferase [Falsibacillus albus]|uniref:GNAT family N-acetyltransferase n=1 Tax=Falsibacillus albus TaxID=2478915 RepID=A0A3L7JVD9_9BACI|nr:GNAT family N-acetyltransferase [Falsibacillus albus]RLQ94275.1 GNAT family N-acetyltransferase [Falsibacillus albus]